MNTLFFDIETVPIEVPEGADDEAIKKLSLSACTARVLCLGYAINSSDPFISDGNETVILQSFWSVARTTGLFVGYNIIDFDLKFIWQRSIILGVKPTRDIPFVRFRQAPVFDVMQEWSKWGKWGDNVSLDTLARALGIESPKDGIDGSKVFEFYQAGRVQEIYDYCRRDVETVRAIYRRIRGDGR